MLVSELQKENDKRWSEWNKNMQDYNLVGFMVGDLLEEIDQLLSQLEMVGVQHVDF